MASGTALLSTLQLLLSVAAFILALIPSVLKMYETSHWYREGDPSNYDNDKDWFANNNKLPFFNMLDSEKLQMRLHYFIYPYMAMAAILFIANLIPTQVSSPKQPRAWMIGRTLLNRTFTFPDFVVGLGCPERVSIGEVLGATVLLFLNFLTLGVRVRRSLPRGSRKLNFLADLDKDVSKEEILPVSWQASEIWAKTLGVLTILNLGWYLLMPIGRRSVLLEALGLSWERAVKYHRWVGFYTVFLMVLHGVMYIIVWIHDNGNPDYDPEGIMLKRNLAPWGCNGERVCDDDQKRQLRVNMYGFVCLAVVMIMTVFALPRFRRKKFEWFYYTHHLFVFLLLFVSLHYGGSIIYLIPGIAVYGVDKFMAITAYRKSGFARTTMVSSDVLEVTVRLAPTVQYRAGQYLFLNVPDVSFLEYHPFSLTSSPNVHGNKVTFHLKDAGSWTEQVIAAGRAGNLKVRCDAFYGHDYKSGLLDKQGAVLVGGGIGVTPMMSLALDICETDPGLPVTLLWVVRTVDEFRIFSDELVDAKRKYGGQLDARVWITLSRPEPDESEVSNLDDVLALLHAKSSVHLGGTSNGGRAFVIDKSGFSPPVNALIMLFAMFVAVLAFASSTDIKNEYGIETKDLSILLDLSMVCVGVASALFCVNALRRALSGSTSASRKQVAETDNAESSTKVSIQEVTENSSVGSFDDEEADDCDAGKNEILKSMVRVGQRPDLLQEFLLAKPKQNDANIGVLACGPVAMMKSINGICNNSTSPFTWGVRDDENGTDAYFAFTEDDWEW